jgi:hypothetical protein
MSNTSPQYPFPRMFFLNLPDGAQKRPKHVADDMWKHNVLKVVFALTKYRDTDPKKKTGYQYQNVKLL